MSIFFDGNGRDMEVHFFPFVYPLNSMHLRFKLVCKIVSQT